MQWCGSRGRIVRSDGPRPSLPTRPLAVAALIVLLAPVAGRAQPPATGAPATGASPARDLPARPRHTAADVAFMRAMIAHHTQAVAMAALVPVRTARADVRLVAERIAVSQQDELALMRRWLAARGEAVAAGAASAAAMAPHDAMPGMAHDSMAHDSIAMPGMLGADELAAMAAARGAEFDRRFLAGMIRHHEGALVMVRRYFGTPGAAQEAESFAFASDVDADQRAEIARLRRLLGPSSPPPRPRP